MAKKKATETVEETMKETAQFPTSEESTQTEAPETTVQEESAPEEKEGVEEQPAPEVKNDTTPAPAPVVEVPAEVLAYFQNNPDEKAVYFDKTGGMYTASTPKVFLKDAILYQNPNNK